MNQAETDDEHEHEHGLDTAHLVGEAALANLKLRITHVLSIYPKLSKSMLQVGIGTGWPPALWHPALESLIEEGRVHSESVTCENPATRREQRYQVLSLTEQ